MAETPVEQPTGSPTPAEVERKPNDGIDVKQLAEKVYRLMLADVRLERARRGQTAQRQR